MPQPLVDRPIERLECRHNQNHPAARREHGVHVTEREGIVADVLQHIETDNRIDIVAPQGDEIGIQHIQLVRYQVRATRKSLRHPIDTGFLDIDGDHQGLLQEMLREVPDAAADLENTVADRGFGHIRLPLKISRRQLHPLLIADGVFGCGGGNLHLNGLWSEAHYTCSSVTGKRNARLLIFHKAGVTRFNRDPSHRPSIGLSHSGGEGSR